MSEFLRDENFPSRTLADVLKSQYLSKEFNSLFGSTQLYLWEIESVCMLFTSRFISQIMSMHEEDLEGIPEDSQEYNETQWLIRLRKRILRDRNAMNYIMQDTYLYCKALARQSLDRQSRKEGVEISSFPRSLEGSRVGLKDKLFSRLGFGKYRLEYSEKNE